eukprot:TRINITY_DN13512_c0_g1_i2.p1 TRINITY_DN13512_c0_g1~~TRINITY_DN13512_c0_g1_i2.p1  ORF type:complete len:252 (+),score=70.42 TRINITY_DN13512_c0_g1_i2:80-835(+)
MFVTDRYSFNIFQFFFLMIRRPPRSTLSSSSAASDVYKRQLTTPNCPGKFVLMARNPKDSLVSYYKFLHKLLEAGKLKPEYTQEVLRQGDLEGFFNAWIDTEAVLRPGAIGDYFCFYQDQIELAHELGEERAQVFLYEDMWADFDSELDRLARFLDMTLSDRKFEAIKDHTAISAMKHRKVVTVNKGGFGGYKKYPVSYTHLRAHETPEHLVCRLLLEKKKKTQKHMIKQYQTNKNKKAERIIINEKRIIR